LAGVGSEVILTGILFQIRWIGWRGFAEWGLGLEWLTRRAIRASLVGLATVGTSVCSAATEFTPSVAGAKEFELDFLRPFPKAAPTVNRPTKSARIGSRVHHSSKRPCSASPA